MRKIAAFIDDDEIRADWLQEIFDNTNAVKSGRQMVGFVNEDPVLVSWYENRIEWSVVDSTDYESTLREIRTRLTMFLELGEGDSLVADTYVFRHAVIQLFYFKVD